jgi:manganese oxidase
MRIALIAALACMIVFWDEARAAAQSQSCGRVVEADIVAIDQPIFLNRLGANLPGGMIYALRRDIVHGPNGSEITAGNAQLNSDRRPRPLVLRVRVGDCLHFRFQNLLSPTALGAPQFPTIPCPTFVPEQTCTRSAGVHVSGMEETVVNGVLMDSSFVGTNPSTLVPPSGRIDYTVRAPAEGVFLMYSTAATGYTWAPVGAFVDPISDGGGPGGQLSAGLFGSVVVEPAGSEWYRSQVTKSDLDTATRGRSADGHPLLNYGALRKEQDGSCMPVLRMVDVRYKISPSGDCVPAASDLVTYYGDLTAIVTGPKSGPFPPQESGPSFAPNAVEPNRHQPFREFVQHYHDVLTTLAVTPTFVNGGAGQAFPTIYNNDLFALGNGADVFAINYGSGGIASEILANRLGMGPEGGCVECRFEEFFLSSWAVGDPAMLVNKPDGLNQNIPTPTAPYQPKTTLRTDDAALYPDDPSNVYHSYVGDRVIFRIVHAGASNTHLHHLHAHQWLHTPNSDASTYLDSQLISPGSAFTQEIDYDGSGNRNRTPGDAIFHCHFYPHFAGGMWGLWRNHDVFEAGTDLTSDPTKQWNRALPDGEFLKGTPIPAVLPLPTLPMAPLPARTKLCPIDRHWDGNQVLGTDNNCPPFDAATAAGEVAYVAKADFDAGHDPGFPFYIPGIAGQRAPHPPLGYASDNSSQAPGQTAYLDGGLARHITLAGEVSNEHHNAWDFSKDLDSVLAIPLAEAGTPLERLAMQTHSTCMRASVTPEGRPGNYLLNGGPSVPGAPYANPSWGSNGKEACVDLADPPPPRGEPGLPDRVYKAADVQMDVVFNKVGWHFPQTRFETLWQDVIPTLAGKRAPEPLFIRANSGETIEFWQTNLVPNYYEVDDFQVRTPTDVIGQHIHLVKFDVTSSDGAANGYNYESGSLSPDTVRAEIAGIRKASNCVADAPISFRCPVAKAAPPDLGKAPVSQDWTGAQTTVERWWADPVIDKRGVDRTLRTVFTHDHFSPSTHQQTGLYSGLLVEPKGSNWRIPALTDPGSGQIRSDVAMGARLDGGPTSWTADVITSNPAQSYREFAIEFQDSQQAYTAQSVHHPVPYPCGPGAQPVTPPVTAYDCSGINPPTQSTATWGWASQANALLSPLPAPGTPQFQASQLAPTIINALGAGVSSVNYRSEPLPLRVAAASGTHDPSVGAQDLALAYASIPRETAALNTQPPNTQKLFPGDPTSSVTYPGGFIGAEDQDPYTPLLRAYPNDHVQVRVLVGAHELDHAFAIHGVKWLVEPSYSDSGFSAAQPMGISEHFEMLFTLPPAGPGAHSDYLYQPDANFPAQEDGLWGILRAYNTRQPDLPALPNNKPPPHPAPAWNICPKDAPHRTLAVSVVTAASALPSQTLTYNTRSPSNTLAPGPGPITQPDAILYVPSENLDANQHLKSGAPIEPLILRAAAGECIDVTLTNLLDPAETDVNGVPIFNQPGQNPDIYPPFGPPNAEPPIPIYPSARAGLHAQQLEADITTSDGTRVGNNPDQTAEPKGGTRHYTWYAGKRDGGHLVPAELGVVNLQPADPIEQPLFGAVGALVIEPPNAVWRTDPGTAAAATVFAPPRLAFREFVGVWQTQIDCTFFPPSNSCAAAQNFGPPIQVFEGVNYRAEPLQFRTGLNPDIANAYSDTVVASPPTSVPVRVLAWDPQTPVFWASSGMPVRFRFVNPGGQIALAEVFGHHWQEEPWRNGSTRIGDNPLSQTMGGQILESSHVLNLIVDRAGAPGDYLYRNFIADLPSFPPLPNNAMWGVFRVGPQATDVLALTAYERNSVGAMLSGYVTPDLRTERYASEVRLVGRPDRASVDQTTGRFQFALKDAPDTVTARSSNGGEASTALAPAGPAVAAAVTEKAVPSPAQPEAVAQATRRYQVLLSLGQKYRARMVGRHTPSATAVVPSSSQPVTTVQPTKSPP